MTWLLTETICHCFMINSKFFKTSIFRNDTKCNYHSFFFTAIHSTIFPASSNHCWMSLRNDEIFLHTMIIKWNIFHSCMPSFAFLIFMAMEMGNIELMVKLQVFTYIRDQCVVHTRYTIVSLIRLDIWSHLLGYINQDWPEVNLFLFRYISLWISLLIIKHVASIPVSLIRNTL